MFDVIVIGAGPCGTAAAFDLLHAGLSVLIVDKVGFPRKKACAGGITPKAYNLFRYDITPMIKRVCCRVNVRCPDGTAFPVRSKDPLCYMTQRSELDAFSLDQVVKKGAVFKIISKIHSIRETGDRVQIDTVQGLLVSKFVVGADGAASRVRQLTAGARFWRHQPGLEADVYVQSPGIHEMEFDFSNRHKGYFWIFPKDDHVNIGIYAIGKTYRLMRDQLVRYARERLGAEALDAVKGFPICTGGFTYKPGNNRILLAGDAAGFAEKLLGEGIYFAVKSGQFAARAIIEAISSGKASASERYDQKLRQVRTDLKLHEFSSNFLYRFPGLSLRISSVPAVHRPFARGYARGKTLSEILLNQ